MIGGLNRYSHQWSEKLRCHQNICFLWLFTKNKLLTRDNLCKRKNLDDKSGIFCSENESTYHIFFIVVYPVSYEKMLMKC
jgi:hypothetical protein